MAFTAKDVLSRTTTILQDAGAVRWPLSEQLLWLNDATREIAILKPNATAKTVVVPLVAGTKQTIPATAHALIQVTRNVDGANNTPGRVITPIVREVLDAQMPGWHDQTKLPYGKVVKHVIDDPFDQQVFYVVPGNDGTGKLEAVVSALPAEIATPADPFDIDAYTGTVDLPEIYRNAVIDYVLYRAFSKDMNLAGAANRAVAHYQQFSTAIGVKTQAEAAVNVNEAARGKYSQ